jgi:hypothetical protein
MPSLLLLNLGLDWSMATVATPQAERRTSSRLSRASQQESLAATGAMIVHLPDPDDIHATTAAMIVNDPYAVAMDYQGDQPEEQETFDEAVAAYNSGASDKMPVEAAVHSVDNPEANYIAGGLAIAITVPLNAALGIPHPPSCATAFIAASAVRTAAMGEAFIFLVFPITTGMAVMILVACIGNNILDGPYPLYWW